MTIASSMKELTQTIASSREERRKAVSGIKADAESISARTHSLLNDFGASREQAKTQLRRHLARERSVRRREVNSILGNARQSIAESTSRRGETATALRRELGGTRETCRSEIAGLLEGFKAIVGQISKSRQATGLALRNYLAADMTEIRTAVGGMRRELRKTRAEVKDDLRQAHEAWQSLGRKTAAIQADVPTGTAKEPVAPGSALDTRLLQTVRDNPGGITLAEAARIQDTNPIALGRAAKRLLEQGKVRKEDRTYFPATGA